MLPSPQRAWVDTQKKGKFLLTKPHPDARSDDLLTEFVYRIIKWPVTEEFYDSRNKSKLWKGVVELPIGDG